MKRRHAGFKMSISKALLGGFAAGLVVTAVIGTIAQNVLAWICGSVLGASAVALAYEWALGGSLRSLIGWLQARSKKLDLSRSLPQSFNVELAQLTRYVNSLQGQLHNVVYDIVNVSRSSQKIARHLETSSTQSLSSLKVTSERLAQIRNHELAIQNELRTAEQRLLEMDRSVGEIEESSQRQGMMVSLSIAAVTQMIASLRNISRTMGNQNRANDELGDLSKQAESAMEGFVQGMKEINESVGLIQESVSVIQEVADQSSLLAMNAAIESAHAGEVGKGFSVVAEEMRKMADQTKSNSQTVKGNLGRIFSQIKKTQEQLTRAADLFSRLFVVFEQYTQSIHEVSISLSEMDGGTTEIQSSLEELNESKFVVETAVQGISASRAVFDKTMKSIIQSGQQTASSLDQTFSDLAELARHFEESVSLGSSNLKLLEALQVELDRIKISDISELKATDGQPLIFWDPIRKSIPPRPENPESFPPSATERWWDFEFGIRTVEKLPVVESSADGPRGKKVAYILSSQEKGSSFVVALKRGAQKLADFYGIELELYYCEYDPVRQKNALRQAVESKADLLVVEPVDVEVAHSAFVELYQKSIPVVVTLQGLPKSLPYVLSYTGPDDWAQTRELARFFADSLGKKGGYAVLQHVPGSAADTARTFGAISELAQYAPSMRQLDQAYPQFQTDKAAAIVTEWLERYALNLNGIICADDGELLVGVVQALSKAGRHDVVVCAAGNSKTGMDFVKQGKVAAITYQSAESVGALPILVAADYFSGVDVAPVVQLPVRLITAQNVDEFYPPQF